MNALAIVNLALEIGVALTEACERHVDAQAALAEMLAAQRGPTPKEVESLRRAGVDVDARLDELLG